MVQSNQKFETWKKVYFVEHKAGNKTREVQVVSLRFVQFKKPMQKL